MKLRPTDNINELPITVRTYNCLNNSGIKTIQDLLDRPDWKVFLSIPNFGKVCLDDLHQACRQSGIEPPNNQTLSKLRDLYAAYALQGLIAHGGVTNELVVAKLAFKLADAMIKARMS